MKNLKGKVLLITGGGTGIGRATAMVAIDLGAKVFVVGRRSEPLESLRQLHPEAVGWCSADVSEPGAAKKIVAQALDRFGRLDALINNAGVFVQSPLAKLSDDEISRVFNINVLGAMSLIREAIPALSEAQGSVVNVSSTLTRAALPETSLYTASKGAMETLTRVLASELGPQQIRVNAVSPGVTETEINAEAMGDPNFVNMMLSQTPLGRLGKPDDVAKVIVQLCCKDLAWVTGQVIQAGGGLML